MYLSDKDKDIIAAVLKRTVDPTLVYVFGSFARGEGRDDSDVDIAVFSRMPRSGYELYMASGELALALKREVQLLDLRKVSAVLGAQIVGNHEVVYCEDEVFRANLNIRLFKEYTMLNEERACVLERVREEGQVYGARCLPEQG